MKLKEKNQNSKDGGFVSLTKIKEEVCNFFKFGNLAKTVMLAVITVMFTGGSCCDNKITEPTEVKLYDGCIKEEIYYIKYHIKAPPATNDTVDYYLIRTEYHHFKQKTEQQINLLRDSIQKANTKGVEFNSSNPFNPQHYWEGEISKCSVGCDGEEDGPFCGGDGTAANPYQICSLADLEALADSVNNGNNWSAGKYFILMNDITDSVRKTIGRRDASKNFCGNFDGNGHIISMAISIDSAESVGGLFMYINNATIKNLGVTGYIKMHRYSINNSITAAGTICGVAESSNIINCFSNASVSGAGACFGIAAALSGNMNNPSRIINCYSTGSLTTEYNYGRVYGIAGITNLYCQIINSYSICNLNAVERYGIIGDGNTNLYSDYNVQNCYYLSTMNISTHKQYGIPKTATEMKSAAFINTLNAGQNPPVWKQDVNNINNGFPILYWQK